MIRQACIKRGHKWSKPGHGFLAIPNLPYQFCNRWFCDGCQVNPYCPMPSEIRSIMEAELRKNSG